MLIVFIISRAKGRASLSICCQSRFLGGYDGTSPGLSLLLRDFQSLSPRSSWVSLHSSQSSLCTRRPLSCPNSKAHPFYHWVLLFSQEPGSSIAVSGLFWIPWILLSGIVWNYKGIHLTLLLFLAGFWTFFPISLFNNNHRSIILLLRLNLLTILPPLIHNQGLNASFSSHIRAQSNSLWKFAGNGLKFSWESLKQ